MLVLWGVAESQAILFALAVHTIQTALVVALGIFGWMRVNIRPRIRRQTEVGEAENQTA